MINRFLNDTHFQTGEALRKYGIDSYGNRAERIAKFIELDISEFNEQNKCRAEKYLDNLVSAIKNDLNFPNVNVFPDLEEINNYPIIRKFEENKDQFFDSEYKSLLHQFYDDQLKDSINEDYLSNVRMVFKDISKTPNKILELISLEKVSLDRRKVELINPITGSNRSWTIYADKQGGRKPKCIQYHSILQYGQDKNKLLVDLAYFDFRAIMLNAGPFPNYSKYSVNECIELEFVKQFIQLSIFKTITNVLDEYLTKLQLF